MNHLGKTVMYQRKSEVEVLVFLTMSIFAFNFRHFLQEYAMCSILHSTGVCVGI